MSTTAVPVTRTHKRGVSVHGRTRYLYAGFSVLLLILMFTGFQLFYMHGRAFPDRPLTPPIRNYIILHGVSTTMWMGLLVTQALLISQRLTKLHMKLGLLGAGLAALVTISGILVAFGSARVSPPEARLWDLTIKHFMLVPLVIMIIFGTSVTIAIINRKRSAIHKPLMYLATLFMMPAPIDRIPAIVGLYQHNILGDVFGPFVPCVVIGGAFLVFKWLLTRSWDRPFAIVWAIMVIVGSISMFVARTPALANPISTALFG